MADKFLHGIEMTEGSTGARTVTTRRMNTVFVCGTAPGADASVFPINKNVLIPGTASMIAALGQTGTLAMTMKLLNKSESLPFVVVCRVEEGADDNETMANIIGGIDENGDYTGIKRAALSEQDRLSKVVPRILIAPYYSHNKAVTTALLESAEKLRAVTFSDAPNDESSSYTDAIAYRKEFGSKRANVCYPWIEVYDVDAADYIAVPPSIAGAYAEAQTNYYESSSMTEVGWIEGLTKPVTFEEGNSDTIANLLNENGVTTFVQQLGWRFYGNRTASDDPVWKYRAHVRLDDSIAVALVHAHVWAKDKNITLSYTDTVISGVTKYLEYLATPAINAIAGGKAWLDPELNTAENMVGNGHVYFDFDYGRFGIAERISFRRSLNNDYVTEIFE